MEKLAKTSLRKKDLPDDVLRPVLTVFFSSFLWLYKILLSSVFLSCFCFPWKWLGFLVCYSADEEYLYVEGLGIITGDRFQFYAPNDALALSTCDKVNASLERLNLGIPAANCHQTAPSSANSSVKKEEVFGGFIFSCSGRGEYFFGPLKADTSPFTKNFPGVPLAGIFCGGEIGRCSSSLSDQNPEGARPVSLCSHVFSSVYLVMTYTPHHLRSRQEG